jgi:hypothetical protein
LYKNGAEKRTEKRGWWMAAVVGVYGRLNRLVGVGLVQDVLNSLVNGVDGVGVLVGDLNAELLLDGHDNLDSVKRVEAEVVGEVSGGLDLFNSLGK